MSDLVERLRDWASNSTGCNPANAPCAEAADEIERLSAKLVEATKMLSEQDREYSRKTNALIERHSAQMQEIKARHDRRTGAEMTYEEAIEKMGKAFEDEAEYSAYELVNEKECIRAAAEAIGLKEMMERDPDALVVKLLKGKNSSLHITFNEHKSYYKSEQEALAENDERKFAEWASDEEKAAAVERKSIWQLQWYPHTPVGFNVVAGSSWAAAVKFALEDK